MSKKSFSNAVNPHAVIEGIRSAYWTERLDNFPSRSSMSICAKEKLPPGADSRWAEWKCLNRLRTGTGGCKVSLKKRGFLNNDDVMWECGTEPQSMEHLMRYCLLEHECKAEDLAEYNECARNCVQLWLKRSV